MGVGSPRRKNKVKKKRQIMRGLVLSGLLACAHGLGDTFPYLNTAGHVWNTQTAGEWINTGTQRITGTKQSPIDIVSTAAATPTVDPGALVAKGFNADRPLTWLCLRRGILTTIATTHKTFSIKVVPPV